MRVNVYKYGAAPVWDGIGVGSTYIVEVFPKPKNDSDIAEAISAAVKIEIATQDA